jgi:hypothetical protein
MIAIVTNTSEKIKDLSAITLKNKQGYADKHGYTLHCINFLYDDFNNQILKVLHQNLEIIKTNDLTLIMGADAMFTNWRIKIEDVISESDHVLMARENLNWWPVNDDVMIWRNTKESISLYEKIIDDYEIWKKYPLRIQNHLWNLIIEEQAPITLVEPKIMNQHPNKWQMGNWIIHFFGLALEDKIKRAAFIADYWPDGNPVVKKTHDSITPDVP